MQSDERQITCLFRVVRFLDNILPSTPPPGKVPLVATIPSLVGEAKEGSSFVFSLFSRVAINNKMAAVEQLSSSPNRVETREMGELHFIFNVQPTIFVFGLRESRQIPRHFTQ